MNDKTLDFESGPQDEGDGSAPSFEESLARLEEIVEKLEAGDTELEAALALFEEGISLSRRCNLKLAAVEQRLEVLVRQADGQDATRALDPPDADGDDAVDR